MCIQNQTDAYIRTTKQTTIRPYRCNPEKTIHICTEPNIPTYEWTNTTTHIQTGTYTHIMEYNTHVYMHIQTKETISVTQYKKTQHNTMHTKQYNTKPYNTIHGKHIPNEIIHNIPPNAKQYKQHQHITWNKYTHEPQYKQRTQYGQYASYRANGALQA